MEKDRLICPICGEPTSIYMGNARKDRLCRKHAKELKEGKIMFNGEKFIPTEKEKYENMNCIICGGKIANTGPFTSQQSKNLCYECKTEMINFYEELSKEKKLEEIKTYYYNLKNSIFFINKFEYTQTACKKLYALAKIMSKNHFANAESKAIEDIKYLIAKKKEYLEKQNKKNAENITDQNNENDIKDEIADYRKIYPAIHHCNDGHYVRSSNEKIIDDKLYTMKVWHEYEKRYKAIDGNVYYPDFFLPEYNLFIEFFGVEKSKEKNEHKKNVFVKDKTHNFEFIEKDKIGVLDEVIEDIVSEYQRKKGLTAPLYN